MNNLLNLSSVHLHLTKYSYETVSLAIRYSDYRSSAIAPSDSEKDCSSSRRDSDTPQVPHAPRLDIIAPSGDSESGGSHSPSPRASRRRQVSIISFINQCIINDFALSSVNSNTYV